MATSGRNDTPSPSNPTLRRLDEGNSIFDPLGPGTAQGDTFTGEWTSSTGLSTLSFFAFTDQPLTAARLEWSDDGVNVASGLLATTEYLTSEEVTGGFYVYYPDPQTYLIRPYYRVVLENTGTDQTTMEAYLWQFPLGAKPFTFLAPEGALSTLSKAQLVRAISVGRQPDGDYVNVPATGLAMDIDGVSVTDETPLGASGQYQSGWISTDGFSGIEVTVDADVVSATDGLHLEFTSEVEDTTPKVIENRYRTFTTADVAAGAATFRFAPIGDGFRLSYTNGGTAQGDFFIEAVLHSKATIQPRGPLDTGIAGTSEAVTTRGGVMAPSSIDGDWGNVGRSPGIDNPDEGLHTYIVGSEELPIKALDAWSSTLTTVTITPVELTSSTPLANRKTITVKASKDNNKEVHLGPTSAVSTGQAALRPGEVLTLELDDTAEVWCRSSTGSQQVSVVEIA